MVKFKTPLKLQVVSDGDVLEFVEIIDRDGRTKLPEPKYIYKYITETPEGGRPSPKLGKLLPVTLSQLERYINDNIFKEIL